jgi:hypothetical protein
MFDIVSNEHTPAICCKCAYCIPLVTTQFNDHCCWSLYEEQVVLYLFRVMLRQYVSG